MFSQKLQVNSASGNFGSPQLQQQQQQRGRPVARVTGRAFAHSNHSGLSERADADADAEADAEADMADMAEGYESEGGEALFYNDGSRWELSNGGEGSEAEYEEAGEYDRQEVKGTDMGNFLMEKQIIFTNL